MSLIEQPNHNRSSGLLIFLGVLWLILATVLLYYQSVQSASIKVEWNTETELETAGFYVYRAQSPEGEFTLVNETLIPSKGDALSGASYTYTDENVEAGKTYYYLLEEVENDATTNRYNEDMFSFTVPQTAWWSALLTAVSLTAGLALLITGIRERNNK